MKIAAKFPVEKKTLTYQLFFLWGKYYHVQVSEEKNQYFLRKGKKIKGLFEA